MAEAPGTGTPAELLEPVVALARDAGERIMGYYGGGYAVQEKADRTPVTAADLAAHDAIAAGLCILTPELPVLSEESSEVPYAERRAWTRYWLVDPLDGTREFIRHNNEFSVNIALIEEHRPVLGVVHVPASTTSFFAADGSGAYRQEGDRVPVPIHVRRNHLRTPVIAVSRSRRGTKMERFLRTLGSHETLLMGSSLKACLVAEGAADLYPSFGPTSEWDTAAAQCLVEEAGGLITDTRMRPLIYNKESLANPHFFAFGNRSRDWSKFLD